jgi:5-methylcytosine-specific restriction endonuclease McrA
MRGAKVGHPVSKETREKISKANSGERHGMYGKTPWNKDKKGYMGANKTSFLRGLVPWNKGLPRSSWISEEGMKSLRPFVKGHVTHNAGKHKIEPLHDIYYCSNCGKQLIERQVSQMLCRDRLNGKHPDEWACSVKCNAIIGAKKRTGENHPNWQGGKSFEPYGQGWRERARGIRERDMHQCQLCGKKHCRLDVHHIDYDKSNLDPKNLITLCHSCHMKTGFRREQWITIFRTLFLIRLMFYLRIKGKSGPLGNLGE